MKYRLLTLLVCVLFQCLSYAQNTYELYVGDDVLMNAPTPPHGGALYQTAWAARTQGITVTKDGKYAARAKVTKYFKGVGEVQCDYYWYNYVGNQQITNHSTVYHKIYCKQVNVKLNKSSMTLDVGGSEYLTHSFSPSNVRTKPSVTWSSTHPVVAEVDNSGRVMARSAGTTEIIVKTDQETSATCTVTVVDPYGGGGSSGGGTTGGGNSGSGGGTDGGNSGSGGGNSGTGGGNAGDNSGSGGDSTVPDAPSSVSLPSQTYMTLGYAYVLTPMLSPANSKTSFTWTSSDISIATVNSSGKVTAKKLGSVTIKVQTPNGLEAQTVLNINEPESGLDNRNVNVRFARIRSLASDTLNER